MIDDIQSLAAARDHARAWLFERAAPLWLSAGVAPDGLFAEKLDREGRPVAADRRLRVQARQIYSFCAIGALGWDGDWATAATLAAERLLAQGRREDGFFGHLFGPEGGLRDSRRDLYDHAFALFALIHAGRALERDDFAAAAAAIALRIEREWSRPEGGLWEGDEVLCPPYRQNPHMHMFEAALAGAAEARAPGAAEAAEAVWMRLRGSLGALFRHRLWDRGSGAVTEYFERDWSRRAEDGDIVEPGHCFEWAWLIETAPDEGDRAAISDALTGFARRFGLCPRRGVAVNEVLRDGSLRNDGARLWPQTERLKAAMARWRRTGAESEIAEAVAAYRGLARYFVTATPGLWFDKMRADGTFAPEDAPASSLYHIVCALSELLR